MEKKRIAIVGSGVSGLSALWTLRNTPHEIHVFEAENRIGGHTNTVDWTHNGKTTPVDTGFIVMNTATYPNFIAFLKELKLKTIQTEMTFGISRDQGAFEWSGTSPSSIFAQRRNIFRPAFWRMIFDIIRFNQFALDLLAHPPAAGKEFSIGDYLHQEGYSDAFRDDYLIPMTACVWSTDADKCALEFPALTLVRFLWNHHLLNTIAERPPWLTIEGGSQKYIDAVLQAVPKAQIHKLTPVQTLKNDVGGKVVLQFGAKGDGRSEVFDEVILACHGDQAYRIIQASSTREEKEIMTAFECTPNIAYLHNDLSLMPQRRIAWSSWNYLTTSHSKESDITESPSGRLQTVSLTYNMNILQSLPESTYSNVLVTLNPPHPPSSSLTQGTYAYRHPLYNARAVTAQEELENIQGKRGVWFCGAWTGYGFHEDGFGSGMRVALRLGGSVPWKPVETKFVRGTTPVLGLKDYLVRVVIVLLQFAITMLERVFGIERKREGEKVATNGHANGTANGNMNGHSEKKKEL